MTEKQDPKPVKKQGESGKPLATFEARRAQNLRENLLKRKAQARARAAADKT
jgi:hypothetical protein